jgi:hypothetical protein
MGICIFFAIYWILPSLFQINSISNMESSQDNALGVGFIFARLGSLVSLYIQLPLTQFPFVFLVSPFIAFLLIRRQLRKEEGTMEEKLQAINWDFSKSPWETVKERLESGDWSEEKQLFKLLVVLLPVSLYLLTTLLDILNVKSTNFLSSGSTALGYFMEILFAYLASFLMGIHLSASSRLSYKGRFIGEKLREEAFSSLTTVGAPISILSILLFVAQAVQQASIDSIYVTIYFFGYFIMAAFIFATVLAIFEPISIFILIKIVSWWKGRQKSLGKVNWKKFGIALAIGAIGTVVAIFALDPLEVVIQNMYPNPAYSINLALYFSQYFGSSATPSLAAAITVEVTTLINVCEILATIFIMGIALALTMRIVQNVKIGVVAYVIGAIIAAIAFGFIIYIADNLPAPDFSNPLQFSSGAILWLTTTPTSTTIFGDQIFTMRLMFLGATSDIPALSILGAPYTYSRVTINVVWIGLFIYFTQRKFTTHSVTDGENVSRTTFTNMDNLPGASELEQHPQNYLCTIDPAQPVPETEKAEVKETFEVLSKGASVSELMSRLNIDFATVEKRLRFLFQRKFIVIWRAEFSYTFKEAQLKGLNVIYSDGRDVFSHQFQESNVDPALVAGMFSAITSFIKETTKSSDLLRSIDHGDTSVIIEYGKYVFAAIFADRETSEVRAKLREFIEEFEDRHGSILVKWNGNVDPFEEDTQLVSKIFS